MFVLIRLLVIVAIVWLGYANFKYRRTRDVYWLRLLRWTIWALLAVLVVLLVMLTLDRLAH